MMTEAARGASIARRPPGALAPARMRAVRGSRALAWRPVARPLAWRCARASRALSRRAAVLRGPLGLAGGPGLALCRWPRSGAPAGRGCCAGRPRSAALLRAWRRPCLLVVGPLVRAAAARVGRRAALPADGAEPLARGRPRPARQPRAARTIASTRRARSRRTTARRARDGRPFPAHSPGLPLLLAPVYALGGRAAVRGRCWRCAARGAGRRRGAWLARRAGATPRRARAGLGGLRSGRRVVLLRLPRLHRGAVRAGPRRWRSRSAAGAARADRGAPRWRRLAVAALPWLHLKMICRRRPRWRAWRLCALRGRARARVLLAVAAVAAPRSSAYYQYVFGVPTPLAIYGGVPAEIARAARCARWPGLLLDRSFGLLPVRAGLPAGPGRAWRRWRRGANAGRVLALVGWRCWRPCCPGGCGGAGSARRRASWCRCVPVLAVALAARVARSADAAWRAGAGRCSRSGVGAGARSWSARPGDAAAR